MKKPVIIVVVLAFIAIGIGVYLMSRPAKTSTTSPDSNTDGTTLPQPTTDNQSVTTVTYADSGFSPSTATIKSGEQVKFANSSSRALQLDSDPHPAHTDNEELNVGVISKGESVTVKLSTKGTWNYHNHLRSGDTGTIIVQ